MLHVIFGTFESELITHRESRKWRRVRTLARGYMYDVKFTYPCIIFYRYVILVFSCACAFVNADEPRGSVWNSIILEGGKLHFQTKL